MKNHIILTAAMMLCLCHLQGQPQTNVSASLETKFLQEFGAAENIIWFRAEPVTYAQFKYQDQFWLAYYDDDDQLVATARKIRKPEDLPILVWRSLEDFRGGRGVGMDLGGIYEWIHEGSPRYLFTLDDDQKTYTLTADSMGRLSIIDKNRKSKSPGKSKQENLIARRIRG